MKNYIKISGILALVIGIAGFVFFTEKKSTYEIFRKTYTTKGKIGKVLNVDQGHCYRVAVWGIDEEMGLQRWGKLTAKLLITDPSGAVVCERPFNASASPSQESGGIKRAQNGAEFLYRATGPGVIRIALFFEEGYSLELKIFKDIGDAAHLLPSLFVILCITGIVLFLKGRTHENIA